MVLLEGLARLSAKRQLTLSVGHVHHGLRGEEANRDEAAVLARAARLGLESGSERVDPPRPACGPLESRASHAPGSGAQRTIRRAEGDGL